MPSMGLGKKKSKEVKERPVRGDDFNVNIKLVTPKPGSKSGKTIEKTLMEGSGSWLSHLTINNEVLWRIEDPVPTWMDPEEKMGNGTPLLPSDSIKRGDLEHIKN